MKVGQIMSKDPACCTPETSLPDVARMMIEHDCGEIPVVDSFKSMRPIGVVTDRDITCRTVAQDKNPVTMTASECMTTPCVTVTPDTSIEECCELLEKHQLRRIPVVDDSNECCGIVAQADIARRAPKSRTAEMLREVSRPVMV